MITEENGQNYAHTGKKDARRVFPRGEEKSVERELLHEHRMELWVNDVLTARLVCTPNHLEAYVVGRLITEGIIEGVDDIESLHIGENGRVARVFTKTDAQWDSKPTEEPTSVLGSQIMVKVTGKRPLVYLHAVSWQEEWIYNIVDVFSKDSALHKTTGGTHSCVLAVEGEIIHVVEDLGRHNAMDKAIGYGALQGISPQSCILFTTGRVPVDMVSKVIRAQIPILISKSVPTFEAVKMAEVYGLTLICRAWPDSFEVYA